MEETNPKDVVRFLIYRANGHMATTRLHKMAYLAELMGSDRLGSPISNVEFIRDKYGPWSPSLAHAIEAVEGETEDIEVSKEKIATGMKRVFKPRVAGKEAQLPSRGKIVLERLWSEWGYVPTKLIVAYCKGSGLFLATQEKHEIDLLTYRRWRAQAVNHLMKAKVGETITLPVAGYAWNVTVESEGFSAHCTEFPACITQGEALADLEANMREAILALLEVQVNPREVAA